MGFTSWMTADTKETIPNIFAIENDPGRFEKRPVYLLRPGKPAVEETDYEGYGVFGGRHVHEWLVLMNGEVLEGLGIKVDWEDDKKVWQLGMAIDLGSVMQDVEDGSYHYVAYDYSCLFPGTYHRCSWMDAIPGYDINANVLRWSGRWKEMPLTELIEGLRPLKFSFDRNARYEDLPASERCPDQGYFYE